MLIRPYLEADRSACLQLLRGNVPEHFVASDENDFAGFLDTLSGPYFVVEDGHEIVACGGIAADDDEIAALCWGIVAAHRQRMGIGTMLTAHRIETFLALHPRIRMVRIHTTQKVQAFYEKHGFEVKSVRANAYGEGLDHVVMHRTLMATGAASLSR